MSSQNNPAGGSQPAAAPQAKDPICGMTVDPKTAAGQHEYKGKTYYFCCKPCLEKFKADPGKYVTA